MSPGLFQLYFSLGLDHILDLQAYDHFLFILTLCSVYSIYQWKKLAILVTAFTIGHSFTLAISALDLIRFSSYWIEILIPATIAITALTNLFLFKSGTENSPKVYLYFLALLFGLIHGCGFSTYLKAILPDNSELVPALFSFNVGIEFAQLGIVLAFITILAILQAFQSNAQKFLRIFINLAALIVASWMIIERI